MDIYILLYNHILLLEERDSIKKIIRECINKGRYICELNKYVNYELGENTESYISKVYDRYIFDYEIGVQITKILYKFISDNKAILIKNNNCRWFFEIFTPNTRSLNLKDLVLVNRYEYEDLLLMKNSIDINKKEMKQISESQILKYKNSNKCLLQKNNDLKNENKILLKSYNQIRNQYILNLGEQYLINKKLLLIKEDINHNDISIIRENYRLSKIYTHSSLNHSSTLQDYVNNSEIIIFSTSQAKHSIYNKIKNNEKLFRTNKTNLESIIKEYIIFIGKKILNEKEEER